MTVIAHVGVVDDEIANRTRIAAEETTGVGIGRRQVADDVVSTVKVTFERCRRCTDAVGPLRTRAESGVKIQFKEESFTTGSDRYPFNTCRTGSSCEGRVFRIIIERSARIDVVGEVGQLNIIFNDAGHLAAHANHKVNILGELAAGGGKYCHTSSLCLEGRRLPEEIRMSCHLVPYHAVGSGWGNGIALAARYSISRNSIGQHHRSGGHNSTDAILNGSRTRIKTRTAVCEATTQTRLNTCIKNVIGHYTFCNTCNILTCSTHTFIVGGHLLVIVAFGNRSCFIISHYIANVFFSIYLSNR